MFLLFPVLWLFVGVGLLGLGLRYKTYQKKLGQGVSHVFVKVATFKYTVKCVCDTLGVEEVFIPVSEYSTTLKQK